MRLCSKLIAIALAALTVPALADAGIYSSAEPKWKLSGDIYRKYQEDSLTKLKQVGSAQATEPWQKYCDLAATALYFGKDPPPRGQEDKMTPQERLDLAACLLRIRQPGKQVVAFEKAIEQLKAAYSRDKDNFLIMSTMATAYQLVGDYQQADDWFSMARPYWEKPFDKLMGELSVERKDFLAATLKWDKDKLKDKEKHKEDYALYAKEFDFYAKCEKYQRKLARLRYRELRKGILPIDKALTHLDPLFEPDNPPPGHTPLRFVSDSGKFEPGKIADVEKAKVPPEAIEVVEQLLVWMPDDLRLFWLLGELFNAKKDVEGANLVSKELGQKYGQAVMDQRFSNLDQKQILAKVVQNFPALGQEMQALEDYVPPPPDISASDFSKGKGQISNTKSIAAKKPEPAANGDAPVVGPLKLDWQTLLTGIAFGLVVGFLIAWRLRDLMRRRQLRVGTNAK